MKALVCNTPFKIEKVEIEKPSMRAGHALLRITRIGICGTDLHAFEGTQPFFSYPRILGHELAATIVDIDGTSEFQQGESVTFIPYWNCGDCRMCRQGRTNCCSNLKVFGVHIDGGMTEFLLVPTQLLLKVNNINRDAVALIEPLTVAAHAIRRAAVSEADVVLIAGAGPIGIGLAQLARMKGATVIIADVNEDRLAYCRQHIDNVQTIHALNDPVGKLRDLTNGEMASVVFDASGNLKALQDGFKYMGHGATYVLVGLQLKEISFSHPEFHKREGTLMSSRNGTREDFEFVIDSITTNKIDPLKMVTHRADFDNVPDQFASWLDPKSKVIKALVSLG